MTGLECLYIPLRNRDLDMLDSVGVLLQASLSLSLKHRCQSNASQTAICGLQGL